MQSTALPRLSIRNHRPELKFAGTMCILGAGAFGLSRAFPYVLPDITPFMAPYWYLSIPLAVSGLAFAVWTDRYLFDAAHGTLQIYSGPFGSYCHERMATDGLHHVQFRRYISHRANGPSVDYRITLVWPDRDFLLCTYATDGFGRDAAEKIAAHLKVPLVDQA